MCGIFGAISDKKNNYDKRTGEKVCQLLYHRGPDDKGVSVFPEGILANTRLAIIDLSAAGHQPMISNDGNLQIVFNGEIYNYKELRAELKKDYKFSSNSDTEVILAAFSKWREKCLDKLRGMFAFAIWNKERKTLFAATDRFSIKQIYYYYGKGTFIFSSEIKPILAMGITPAPNQEAIFDFFTFGLLDHDENTFFKDIFQLRPAHYLVFEQGALKIKRYWDIEENSVRAAKTPKEAEKQVEEALKETIEKHLIADVEPGVALSSGLDSNLIRAIVDKTIKPGVKIKCFNFGFTNTPYDESRFLAALKKKKRYQIYVTPVQSGNFFKRYADLIKITEQPVSGLGTFGYWFNCQTAREQGIKFLLDGQGGDEMFGGYDYYQNKEFITRKASDGTSIDNCGYLSADFQKKFKNRKIKSVKKFNSPFRNAVYNDLMFFKIPKLLRFQDKTAMASSVESRVPFLDHPLCELVFSLSPEILLNGGVKKYLLRKIAERYLGKDETQKPKLYISTPQREWIRGELRPEIQEMMENSILEREGYIDSKKLKTQYKNYVSSKDLGNSFFVWKFFSLELWFRNFIYG